jgi:hypothetical protein
MQKIVARALMKAGGDHPTAREILRWWFRRYMADPNPPTSPLGERHHPLFRLERITDEYGLPPVVGDGGRKHVENRELERVAAADADSVAGVAVPKPHEPRRPPLDRHVETTGNEGPRELLDRHRRPVVNEGIDEIRNPRVVIRRHGGQGNELAEARKALEWLEGLAVSHPLKRLRLDRHRAYVRRLELEHEGKEPKT